MPYTPPPGGIVPLDFLGAFVPQPGGAVLVGFAASPSTLYPPGFAAGAAFGVPSIFNARQYLSPSGFQAGALGAPTVHGVQYVTVAGLAPGGVGIPTAYTRQFIVPAGLAQLAFGTAVLSQGAGGVQTIIPVGFSDEKLGFGADGAGAIRYLNRTLAPSGFITATYGTPQVDDSIRNIGVPNIDSAIYGTAFVAYRVRSIFPNFIPASSYGTATVYNYRAILTPSGLDAGAIGTAFVHDNRQFPAIQGFQDDRMGAPVVVHNPRILGPVGFPSTDEYGLPSRRWGRPEIHNKKQIVYQLYAPATGDGGAFGDYMWMQVANRNRQMQPNSWRSDHFGRPSVLNKARAILPDGLDTLWGTARVEYKNRRLPVPALGPGQIGEYTVVYNNARLVAPLATLQTVFGNATVVNTRRYYPNITAGDQASYGTALVAPRIRSVFAISTPDAVVGSPSLRLRTNYLAPVGIDPYAMPPDFRGQWGLTDLHIHRNIIAPSWLYTDRLGFPTVLNRNRALGMYGLDQASYGRALVENKIKYITPVGVDWSAFGVSPVSYRTRTLAPNGVFPGTFSGTGTQVAKTTADPPFTQTVYPTGSQDDAFGTPAVRPNAIFPPGFDASSYGAAVVTANSIRPAGFATLYANRWGVPSLNGSQFVTVAGVLAPDDPSSSFAKTIHRLSPHTIYCRFDVTAQAVANNGGTWKYMDDVFADPNNPSARPLFGNAHVDLKNRRLLLTGADQAAFGVPTIELKRRYVSPLGVRSLRMGFPVMSPRTVILAGQGFGGESFGVAAMSRFDLNRHLFPTGFAESFGVHRVELLNRVVNPVAIDSLTITPDRGGVAYGPVLSTRVHFPEPIKPVGFDATLFGDTMIDFRIRRITGQGWDNFSEGYTPGFFAARMRVIRRARAVNPRPMAPGAFGVAGVRHG